MVRPLVGLDQESAGAIHFLRFIFLVALYVAAFYLSFDTWSKMPLTLISAYLIIDMFMAPTSIAFGGFPKMRPLRALVFLFFNYISISMAFGILYVTLCRSSFNIVPDLFDLAYFSFTTMTALGLGDITPARHTLLVRFLVVSEVLIGLFFWAVLVGIIIAWAVREAKDDSSLPK